MNMLGRLSKMDVDMIHLDDGSTIRTEGNGYYGYSNSILRDSVGLFKSTHEIHGIVNGLIARGAVIDVHGRGFKNIPRLSMDADKNGFVPVSGGIVVNDGLVVTCFSIRLSTTITNKSQAPWIVGDNMNDLWDCFGFAKHLAKFLYSPKLDILVPTPDIGEVLSDEHDSVSRAVAIVKRSDALRRNLQHIISRGVYGKAMIDENCPKHVFGKNSEARDLFAKGGEVSISDAILTEQGLHLDIDGCYTLIEHIGFKPKGEQ